ncbi:STM3941 family protein [Nocardia tengchongensis]
MTESEKRVGNLEQATVYAASKPRTALLALGAALSVALGYVLVLTTEASAAFVGALSILFFGACLVLMVTQLFRRSPALVITDRGFTHRRLGPIDWTDVDGVAISRIAGQPFVDVALRDPAAYLERSSLRTRLLGRVNQGFGYSPAVFSTQTFPVSSQDVVAVMRNHLPERRS